MKTKELIEKASWLSIFALCWMFILEAVPNVTIAIVCLVFFFLVVIFCAVLSKENPPPQ